MSDKKDENWIRKLFKLTDFDPSGAFVEEPESGTLKASPPDLFRLDIVTLLEMLSAPLDLVVKDGAQMLLSLMESSTEQFYEALSRAIENPLDEEERNRLLDHMTKRKHTAFELSGQQRQNVVSIAGAVKWLQSGEAVYKLVWNSRRCLIVARIDGIDTLSVSACLKSNSQDRLLLVSKSSHKWDFLEAIRDELESFCNMLLQPNPEPVPSNKHPQSKEVRNMIEVPKPVSKENLIPREYARRQEGVESEEKIYMARFAIKLCDPKDGEGAVVDAGSSCFTFFKECGVMIKNGHAYITFYTNSYQILEYWVASRDPDIREIELSILGSKLDRRHLAFHGDIATVMLKPNIFRPAVVVIGTSGIIFDPQDGILFSYHAEGPEAKFKQLLFQCFAGRKRVILCTARKIGFVGAYAFDLLRTDIVDTETPVCLITTGPKSGDKDTAKRFYEMRKVFHSEEMQKRIRNTPGFSFDWIVLDPETGKRIFDEFEKKQDTETPISESCGQ